MADATTTNYGWAYPTVNADSATWGGTLNTAIIAIDAQVFSNANAAMKIANYLSEIAAAGSTAQGTARTNLGLGTAAVHAATDFDAAGTAAGYAATLGTSATQNHTVSTSLPSGGVDGDTWDVVAF